jgi:maleylacetoacetate isomerase
MMRLHGFWRSIATYRVRVALNLKGIPFEEIEVDLLKGDQFSDAFRTLNPHSAVPALEIDGRVLTQSLPIIEYLDRRFPTPPLYPADDFERAQASALALVTVADAHPLMVPRIRGYLQSKLGATDEDVQNWISHWLSAAFATFEDQLAKRPPAPYAFGDSPGIVDIAVAGHCVSGELFKMDLGAYPRTKSLMERLSEIDAFRQAHPLARKAAAEGERR